MVAPLSPQEIQELAAGYVLGDLDSAEAERFNALLADVPELQAEVAALQEALAMMPYGLDEVEPEMGLRSHILSIAQAELSHQLPAPPAPQRLPLKPAWPINTTVIGWAAVGLAMVGSIASLHFSQQIRLLPAQYSQPERPVVTEPDSINQTWSGLSQLLQDHQQSLANPSGPVDFVVHQPDEILALLRGFQTTVAALPLLPAKQGLLLGGSNCQLGTTQGLRLTYQLATQQTVSAYQLDLGEEDFPEFQSAQLTLQQPDGTGIVLWRDDDYLYALVADLPTAELQSLAYVIEGTDEGTYEGT